MSQELYYVVRYTGPFGYIKPWTAVRDSETFSQQFLTPSILCGIERKLFPELLNKPFGLYRIASYRLSYVGMSMQQEQTQPRGWNRWGKTLERPRAILTRGIMLNPALHLAFRTLADAESATRQHLCLCRNEDILFPGPDIITVTPDDFDQQPFDGFELVFEPSERSFVVGYNRFDNGAVMEGWLKIVGNPVKTNLEI
ncbi:hypothetical protein GCM10028806_09650 [Spirosoma terrae]|uniref:Uncharacterized protein n=1 Tax=Spirosoma terrae TaxID=1968276 RepID=A0A6L9LAQ4_9BACT|nr:hypothetical protein [Spirosoma terrae]NDU95893.1 hypothetical protein [Spirosoma terrae]